MSLLLSLMLSVPSVPPVENPLLMLRPLNCAAEEVHYAMPGVPEWAVTLTKPKHAPGTASDLIIMVTGIDFVREFAFASAQGFGGTSLVSVENDEEAGGLDPAENQPEEAMAFHAFAFDSSAGLVRMADPPRSNSAPPVAIYIPDVSKHFWYDEKYVDTETGKLLDERVDMPMGLFIGNCPAH